MDRSHPADAGLPGEETVNPSEPAAERSESPARVEEVVHRRLDGLWEQAFSRANVSAALKRVEANRGAAGVDGMGTDELCPWLIEHWSGVREALDAGIYQPAAVRRVTIPKPGGGERLLGVPSVLDRMIQQAIAQVLTPIFDPHFSGSSFGFRPGRSRPPGGTGWRGGRSRTAIAGSSTSIWIGSWMRHHTAPSADVVVRTGLLWVQEPLFVGLFCVRLGRARRRGRRA